MMLLTLMILAVCRMHVMNFTKDLAHHRVFVAQWWSIKARNPKV